MHSIFCAGERPGDWTVHNFLDFAYFREKKLLGIPIRLLLAAQHILRRSQRRETLGQQWLCTTYVLRPL